MSLPDIFAHIIQSLNMTFDCEFRLAFQCHLVQQKSMLDEHSARPAIGDMPINHTPQFNSGNVVCEGKTRSFDHGSCSSIMVHVVRAKTTSFDRTLRFAEIMTKTSQRLGQKLIPSAHTTCSALSQFFLRLQKLQFATLLTSMSVFGPVIGLCASPCLG